MCNNSGSVYCESCDHVRIERITWDRCGDPNRTTDIAGMTFNVTSNISLVNCTFQNSQISAVALAEIVDNVLIQSCTFLSIVPMKTDYGILSIIRTWNSSKPLKSSHIKIAIFEGYFYNNGFLQTNIASLSSSLSLYIDSEAVKNCDVILNKSNFMSNRHRAILIHVYVMQMINIQLPEVLMCNNIFFRHDGVHIKAAIKSSMYGNYGDNTWNLTKGYQTSVTINNHGSNFTDNQNDGDILFLSNQPTASSLNITCYRVQFNNNHGVRHLVYIEGHKGDFEINM